MPYPLEDAGFTLWLGDIETHLKRLHGLSTRELGFDRHALQQCYYSGQSVFTVIDSIESTLAEPLCA
ncbi:hypothetical protein [Telmatospirillum sp.]|uniref:hypothetical protein n=1 Tax=Telmatospirillum sp. TaxID=2079197 RepID=UPI0028483653|nr:hypothetical protein [Telmatospirillum sp.]MDR3439356.1 hypothetical protein [Telmatospirillum sp.]